MGFAVGLATAAASGQPAEDASPADWDEVRRATFALVWETVNEAHFDPKFGGVDWPAVRERYEPALAEVGDKHGLRQLLQRMLGELGKSHFAILPREAAVFTPEERDRVGTVGAEVAWIDEAPVVVRVEPGGAAEKAGLTPGAKVSAVGEREVGEILHAIEETGGLSREQAGRYLVQWMNSQLHAPVGTPLKLRTERADGAVGEVAVESGSHSGAWSEPVGNLPSLPVAVTARIGDDGIGYLRFNVFARAVMGQVREFLTTLPGDAGLVIDLRGNPGGLAPMAAGIGGWLTHRPLWFGRMQMRQGLMHFTAFPQERAFLGPLAVLIDAGSASTSEVMAAGLQAANRARVFGGRSAGQALPSAFKKLPTGDLFQFAMADIITPRGQSLEGHGVTPDEEVAPTAAELAAGVDRVLEAAKTWLQAQRAARASSVVTGPHQERK